MIDIIIIGKRIVFLKRSCPTFFTLIISETPSPTFLSSPPLGQIFSNFSSFFSARKKNLSALFGTLLGDRSARPGNRGEATEEEAEAVRGSM